MRTPHEILGIEPSATQEEIKTAFRRKAMRTHPDRGGSDEEFRAVVKAYETLQRTTSTGKCVICNGTGQIRTYEGSFVVLKPCPTCWRT